MTDPVVDVSALDDLGDRVVFADVRWYLEEPERGRTEYQRGHIPGAIYVDLDRHLSAREGPGRHPLPTRDTFASRMAVLGIGDGDFVVAYDDRGGAVAARLWWMLRDIGHDAVAVLNGGIDAWVDAGHRLQTGVERRAQANLTVRDGSTRRIDRAELRTRLGTVTLLDARAPERYRGEEEPVDPVAGHITTARSAPLDDNLDESLRFLPPDQLGHRFAGFGAGKGDTVVYCGSGVTACHNALAMVRAGFPEPILYPGSWSDWGTAGEAVATGPEPGSP